jgi:hypothetical protein
MTYLVHIIPLGLLPEWSPSVEHAQAESDTRNRIALQADNDHRYFVAGNNCPCSSDPSHR